MKHHRKTGIARPGRYEFESGLSRLSELHRGRNCAAGHSVSPVCRVPRPGGRGCRENSLCFCMTAEILSIRGSRGDLFRGREGTGRKTAMEICRENRDISGGKDKEQE